MGGGGSWKYGEEGGKVKKKKKKKKKKTKKKKKQKKKKKKKKTKKKKKQKKTKKKTHLCRSVTFNSLKLLVWKFSSLAATHFFVTEFVMRIWC